MAFDGGAATAFGTGRRKHFDLIEQDILLLDILRFILAAFPAFSPFTDEEFETEGINLHARLEANAQISEVHLVLVGVGE